MKVFIKESCIEFINSKEDLNPSKELIINSQELLDLYMKLKNSDKKVEIQLLDTDAKLQHDFKSHFKEIFAAGGLVLNKKNESLWIYRLGKWDLPKGKIETGEDIEEAAIREVQEECGLVNVEITHKLSSSYHTYSLNGQEILKTTYWFGMASNDLDLVPQLEEDISEVKWIANPEDQMRNTYPAIAELILSEQQ